MDVKANPPILLTPGMAPKEIINKVAAFPGVFLTSTAMRDAGQSDFKNRLRFYDLKTLAPIYNRLGLFSAECHGGARWHVGVMNRRENPFEEIRILREMMPNVLLQTLIRETNLWGYRPYPRRIIEYVVEEVDVDVWRCFSFLNDIRNMRSVAEIVLKRGRLFEPAISFTVSDWTTRDYYLGLVREIIDLCSGQDNIILCLKDMAGVGGVKAIAQLIDTVKQSFPDLVIQYHRHITDGLAVPAYLAAARAGAKIFDVAEDSLVRFYGQPPILSIKAFFEESGIPVNLEFQEAERACQKVREWVGDYDWAESPFRGYDYTVTRHRMPGGAFPSSFEQAQKAEFLHLMPSILQLMSLYNRMIRYFDVTPGSQITWVTCSSIVNRYVKEKGEAGVRHLLDLLSRFVEEKKQDFSEMEPEEQEELLRLFNTAPADFKNLLLGDYGKLPTGWPDDWVYQSAFGKEWEEKIRERTDTASWESMEENDLESLRMELAEKLGRWPGEEEFILYLMHPKDSLELIHFREKFGEAPLVLPTPVWRQGLTKPGDKVEFDLWGKPYCLELVSIGSEHKGLIHVVMRINNKTRVFTVETPRSVRVETRLARKPGEIGAPIRGNVWRIGNPGRGSLKVGDIVHKGEEVANLEAMKMENVVVAPFRGQVLEICVKLNETVQENQLLMVLKEI
jgi:pyruvate carboxylase